MKNSGMSLIAVLVFLGTISISLAALSSAFNSLLYQVNHHTLSEYGKTIEQFIRSKVDCEQTRSNNDCNAAVALYAVNGDLIIDTVKEEWSGGGTLELTAECSDDNSAFQVEIKIKKLKIRSRNSFALCAP